jgi:hypothetical protein
MTIAPGFAARCSPHASTASSRCGDTTTRRSVTSPPGIERFALAVVEEKISGHGPRVSRNAHRRTVAESGFAAQLVEKFHVNGVRPEPYQVACTMSFAPRLATSASGM